MSNPLKKNSSFTESANNAIMGIVVSFKNERNLRIHFLMAILVLLLGLWLEISRIELVLLLVAITFMFMAEMVNTSVEIIVNAFTDQEHPSAKTAKDVAAGGVLIAAIGALTVGYLIFFDKVRNFTPHLVHRLKVSHLHLSVVCLVIVLIASIILKTFFKHGTPLRGGMPSGHAALAFATATVILWFVKDLLIVSVAFLLALVVAQSRVETKAHGWWEVTLGALLGFFVTLTIFKVFLG